MSDRIEYAWSVVARVRLQIALDQLVAAAHEAA